MGGVFGPEMPAASRRQWEELFQAELEVEGQIHDEGLVQRNIKIGWLVVGFRFGERDPRFGAGSEEDG